MQLNHVGPRLARVARAAPRRQPLLPACARKWAVDPRFATMHSERWDAAINRLHQYGLLLRTIRVLCKCRRYDKAVHARSVSKRPGAHAPTSNFSHEHTHTHINISVRANMLPTQRYRGRRRPRRILCGVPRPGADDDVGYLHPLAREKSVPSGSKREAALSEPWGWASRSSLKVVSRECR